jgi:hypothetical protein
MAYFIDGAVFGLGEGAGFVKGIYMVNQQRDRCLGV